MKVLHSDIEIQAADTRVWQILIDFSGFPKWNPFIREAKGNPIVGERLEVRIQPSGSRGMTFKPTVLKVEPNRELRWLGHLLVLGLFDGEHIFIIEPLESNRVRFIQREEFRGRLVPIILGRIGADTQRGFEEMNQAIKALAEDIYLNPGENQGIR
jgi:hypothetical protein